MFPIFVFKTARLLGCFKGCRIEKGVSAMYLYVCSGSVDKRLYSHVNDEAHTSSDTYKAFSFLIS